MKDFIHWEQAVNLGVHEQIAVKYEIRIQEIVRWFAKNTIAQLTSFDTLDRAYQLHGVYRNKDYSQFLFEETEKLFVEFEVIEKEVEVARPTFQEAARLVSSIALKQNSNVYEKERHSNDRHSTSENEDNGL